MRKWVNLSELAAARKPDEWNNHHKAIHPKRRQLKRERGPHRDEREANRADDRDEEDEADGEDERRDVDRA